MDGNMALILAAALLLGGCAYKALNVRPGRILLATIIGASLGGVLVWGEAAFRDETGVTLILFFITIPVGAVYCFLPALFGAAIARAVEAGPA